jgi:biopolymer transport protein TolR
MGISVGGPKRGTITEMNVVPLIDILLVLLVIFMVIPSSQGLKAEIPRRDDTTETAPRPEVVVVQVLADGSLRINQQPVPWHALREGLGQIFKMRADRTAFVRGDAAVKFELVAKVIDAMHTAGISSVGLLTPELEGGH